MAIFRLVLREGAVMTGLGLVAGVAGILALRHGLTASVTPSHRRIPGSWRPPIALMVGAGMACLIPSAPGGPGRSVPALAE
jgi:hypothetical protein